MDMEVYKLVITGTFNAGKTTFVKTLSDIDVVNTDKATSTFIEQAVKPATTTALDYGRFLLNERVLVHLFGTPGPSRFDFMRDILAKDMDGFIFLADSTDPNSLDAAGRLLTKFREFEIPYLVAANKSDLPGSSLEEIRVQLDLPDYRMLIPCIATNKDSTRRVIEEVIGLLEKV